jgi:SnoaL-like domain
MLEDQIADLAHRVQALEDQLAIYQLIATYGPAVDSQSARAVGELWSEDGVYDPSGVNTYAGRVAVEALVYREPHLSYLQAGCAHVLSLPRVAVDGDTALAGESLTGLSQGRHVLAAGAGQRQPLGAGACRRRLAGQAADQPPARRRSGGSRAAQAAGSGLSGRLPSASQGSRSLDGCSPNRLQQSKLVL